MSRTVVQIIGTDGCVYLYDLKTKESYVQCPVKDYKAFPENVLETYKEGHFELPVKDEAG